MTDLDAADVLELLADLGARLSQQGLTGQVFVVGGAAMLLDGFVRSVTGDIDVAITASAPEIWAIARLMGRELGLQTTWLSTGAGPFIPTHEAGDTRHFGGLTVTIASDRVLLAMKLVADRAKDVDDIRLLIQRLGVGSSPELVGLVEDVYGREYLEMGLGVLDIRERADWHLRSTS
ncbi:MAG: hypothetical protein KBB39_13520 [Phycicoccus sp.]|nr:hypothetical protein [Phycicoccus sp.]